MHQIRIWHLRSPDLSLLAALQLPGMMANQGDLPDCLHACMIFRTRLQLNSAEGWPVLHIATPDCCMCCAPSAFVFILDDPQDDAAQL